MTLENLLSDYEDFVSTATKTAEQVGNIREMLEALIPFIVRQTQVLIGTFEYNRFMQQGQINDHEKWADNQAPVKEHSDYDNDPYAKEPFISVQEDKGRNEPLVDQGNLLMSLATPDNWDLEPEWNGDSGRLTMYVPAEEDFTDPVYDILETNHGPVDYVSPRGNKMHVNSIPARKFKDISDMDVEMITEQLAAKIEEQFAS